MAGRDVLARIAGEWSDPERSYAKGVEYMVLEFDVDASEAELEPGIFIAFKATSAQSERHDLTLRLLQEVGGLSQQTLDHVERCFTACLGDERISHMALMLSRVADTVRLNVEKLSHKRLSAYLHDIGYLYDTMPLQKRFASAIRYNDEIVLCLDAGPEILPRLGLECYIKKLPSEDARHRHFLDELVRRGLCKQGKADALLACEGFMLPPNHMDRWPEDLLVQSLAKPTSTFSAIERRLNHIKLSCLPDGTVDAKAYVGYKHIWLDKSTPGNSQEEVGDGRHDHAVSGQLTPAIEDAVQFLLASQNQGGWWRDFPTASIGVSDEWITAYVGYVLSRIAEAQSAAADAWALLVSCERAADEGWGWGRSFAADADTTSWAVRLANNVGAEGSERLRSAVAFLQMHQHGCGGLATYEEGYFRDFHRGAAPVDHMLGEWCSPHSCVTAAAVPVAVVRKGALQYLRGAQDAKGTWSSHWWVDPAFPTALCVQMLAEYGEPGDKRLTGRAASWAVARLFDARQQLCCEGESPFVIASAARILMHADDAQYEKAIVQLIDWLLQHQNSDGSWPASARLYSIFDHDNLDKIDVDEHRNHTTATVLDVLTDYRQYRGELS